MAVLENASRLLVVPIVDHVLQQIRIAALRHGLEEVAANGLAASLSRARRSAARAARAARGRSNTMPRRRGKPSTSRSGSRRSRRPRPPPCRTTRGRTRLQPPPRRRCNVAIAASNTRIILRRPWSKRHPVGRVFAKRGLPGAHAVFELVPRVLDRTPANNIPRRATNPERRCASFAKRRQSKRCRPPPRRKRLKRREGAARAGARRVRSVGLSEVHSVRVPSAIRSAMPRRAARSSARDT